MPLDRCSPTLYRYAMPKVGYLPRALTKGTSDREGAFDWEQVKRNTWLGVNDPTTPTNPDTIWQTCTDQWATPFKKIEYNQLWGGGGSGA